MSIQENISLAGYSTMRLGGQARYLTEVKNLHDVQEAVNWAKQSNLPIIMIGRGANIVWRDEGYGGLVLVNKIKGKELLRQDDHATTIKFGGGENWDEAVKWSVDKKLSGLEFMSLVPGTVGAAPVQNVGAYGGELSDVLLEVETFDIRLNNFTILQNHDCSFAYRTSRFKTTDRGRFLITSVTVTLSKINAKPPFYDSLQAYIDEHGIDKFTPKNIREAVIAIRTAKLPDPEKVSNNGSFFTNPLVSAQQYQQIQASYPDAKGWPMNDGRVKLAAGWMVEKAGFKGYSDPETGMATWPNQALVLVNQTARNTADLLAFRQKIIDKVQAMFGVTLEQEPELLP
jgi:UDP-N-acetylmuramate dehydrogenase